MTRQVTSIDGCQLLEAMRFIDERGSFTRLFSQGDFQQHGCVMDIAQTALSSNLRRGTLRGLHFQQPPFEQAKLVQCLAGSLYDVVIDLREESRTYGRWAAHTLGADDPQMLYIPPGCAHGFQTLEPNTQLLYHLSKDQSPTHALGIRWNDPAFSIDWPIAHPIMNERDRTYPAYEVTAGHPSKGACSAGFL